MTFHEPIAPVGCAYAAVVHDFLLTEDAAVLRLLTSHHQTLGPHRNPSAQQRESWQLTLDLLRDALLEATSVHAKAGEWRVLLEYELPFEGGRRPDAII